MKIIALVVGLVLGILLMTGLIIPVTDSALTTAGEEVTLTNTSPIVLREAKDGDILICVRETVDDVTTDNWTLNGEAVIGPTGASDTWNIGIMSDGVYVSINSPSNPAIGSWYAMDATTIAPNYLGGGGTPTAFVFDDGNITIYTSYGTESPYEVVTKPYTWGYVVCPYGEGEYCAPLAGGVGIVKANTDIILCGAYTTGDLDTMYYHYNGVDYVSNSAYSMVQNVTRTLHDGMTDIYDATVSVTISDGVDNETFTPYRILVPYEVTGHSTSGANYALLTAIPIVGLIVLIAYAAYSIRGREFD